MRTHYLLALSVLVFVSCSSGKGSTKRFNIKGKLENRTAEMVYLEEIPMATMQQTVVDSVAPDKNGNFSLKAISGEARVYNIRVGQDNYPAASLINDEPEVSVKLVYNAARPDFPDHYVIDGSPVSIQLQQYMLHFNSSLQEIFASVKMLDSIQKSGSKDLSFESYQRAIQLKGEQVKKFTDSLFAKNENPALTLMTLSYYQSMASNPNFGLSPYGNEDVIALVDNVSKKYPKHQGVATLKAMLNAPSSTTGGLVGSVAPDFSLPDANGKMISLSSFKGKYVLVDFWASWCAPCRQENPNVVAAFKKFRDKNFTVLGVSLDEKKADWLKAVMKDNLTWTQVSDLGGWNSSVVPQYKIEGIPFNVLVDPQGKVIATSLRGEALEATLAQVLK
jgi:peroxiredoxin